MTGARVGQFLLDLVLWIVGCVVIGLGFGLLGIAAYGALGDPGGVILIVLSVLHWALYLGLGWRIYAWWPAKHDGQTLAMGWLKLRVVDEHGGQPTLGAHTLRWLLLFVEAGVVGLIVMLTNPRRQRLGDMVAKTLVVRAE